MTESAWCLRKSVMLFLLLAATVLAAVGGTLHNTTELPPPALLLPCDGLDTCQQGLVPPRAPRPMLADTDWKERNCLCDQDCARYGDCCDDAPAIKQMITKPRYIAQLNDYNNNLRLLLWV